MTKAFESEKNKKALLYTVAICAVLLIMFFLISWKVMPPTPPVVQDLIEINLGNNEDGFGEEQPLIKGERGPAEPTVVTPQQPAPAASQEDMVKPEDNAEEDAAVVNKPVKSPTKIKTEAPPAPVVTVPKPQKPKIVYDGPGKGTGNNATEDNGYKYQGNNPNGKGDNGDPKGDKDSYGNTPGGKTGGPRVIGNRNIIKYYSFAGDLPKAVINAQVKVSPDGRGSFVGFGKGSTTRDARYAAAITRYLANISFNKSGSESTVTVVFNFNEN
ncbi:MAG: TonB C-terminal protein [Ferruginibacter sp.]|nr:TonB C-terminal protein [Ferruginibacter sp.]